MQDQIIVPQGWGQVDFDLPRVCDIEPAISGQGGDDHTFAVAKQIARCTADLELFTAWMTEWNRGCQPPWPAHRLAYNIRKAWKIVHESNGQETFYVPEPDTLLKAKKSRVSFRALDKVAFQAHGAFDQLLAAAAKATPVPPLEKLIDQLYPGNPLICRATGNEAWARTAPRESIRGVEKEFEWIVPSPMRKETGYTKEGKPGSHRCRDNAGPRRYIVIEFDFTSIFKKHLDAWAAKGISGRDVQAALILLLATTGSPRAWPFMIVDTGGKSLHSWYAIHKHFDEQNALDMLARAIPFGADKRAEQPEQFFRFPGGTRKSEKNQPQTILFYDSKKLR